MADLSIFGETRAFTTSGETYNGLGGFNNELKGKLSADGASLDLSLSGEVAQGTVSFHTVFRCRVDQGKIGLLSVSSITQAPIVRVSLQAGWTLTAPEIRVLPATDSLGIAFVQASGANNLAEFIRNISLSLANLRLQEFGRWTGNRVTFDLPTREARFEAIASGGVPAVLFSDQFGSAIGEDALFHEQVLRVKGAWIGDREIGLQTTPESGALFLHPDVLDTTFLKGSDGEVSDNDLLYQYAMANGLFEILYDRVSPLQQEYRWRAQNGKAEEPTAVVCFGLKDEHGHPLLLELPQGGRLDQRDGPTTEVAFETDVFLWEQTNRAALIEALPAPGQDEGRIPCRLRTLDPLSLSPGPRDQGSLTNPYWLNGGRVNASSKPPREIHGLAKGTFLVRNGAAGDGLDCAIATRVVQDPALGKLFVKTDLVLPSAEGWKLMAQTEERELIPHDQPAVDQVGLRAAAGLPGELRLPMIDTSYAFANLTGLERVRRDGAGQPTGEYPASGVLAREGRQWIEEADAQLAGAAPSRFALPALADQTHTSGFGVAPAPLQPFHSILDRPPATAAIAGTARTGAWLMAAAPGAVAPAPGTVAVAEEALTQPARTALFFGGKRDDTEQKKLAERVRNADTPADPQTPAGAAERFLRLWADDSELTVPEREAFQELRRALVAGRPTNGAELTNDFFHTLLKRALDLVQSNLPIPWLEAVRPAVEDWFIEELEEEWRAGTDPVVARLFEYLWTPPSMELFRRALGLLEGLPQAAVLRQLLPYTEAWDGVLRENLEGFLAEMAQGVDPLWDEAVRLWRDEADAVLDGLRRRYGPTLTQDVYQALLANARDAEALSVRLRDTFGLPVERLADLKADPPDYLLITRRFETAGRQREGADALWYHRFDLCDFGGKRWHFFLDSGSTIIVKLTGERTLPEVLREADAAYRTPERTNPLGVPAALLEPGTAARPVEALVSRLHPDLLARAWRGVLIVAPTADISEDSTLKDLAGLEYIQAAYAAVGGRKPDREKLHLDVYASIFQRAPLRPETTESDVKLALIKFDATIKHTEIESGEIVFQLDLADLWGRQLEPRRPLYVRGTLPSAPEGGGPRSFEFAAWFEKPEEIKIGVAFVEAFAFRSIRVGSSQGRTSLDIDGEVIFRESGISLPIDLGGGSGLRLGLENFRILLPQLGNGERFDFGFGRALDFDFPSVSFRLAKPRALNLFGIEIIPQGIGYLRGTALKALKRLEEAYTWLSELDLPEAEAPDFTFPYLQLRIDFGKLPQFGAGGLSGLTFDAILGLQWKGHDLPTVSFGISGVSGKDLKLDLFRLLTLEIRELAVNSFTAKLDASDPGTKVGAFIAEDVRLKILDWSPLPEGSKLSLMLIHPSDTSTRKGLLAWYGNPHPDAGSFFRLYWLLLAHNLELRTEVYNALLKGDPREMGEHPDLVKNLVDIPARQIQARVLDQESWIFGASFGLGDILDRCSFILHDQHYYGIRLSAPWLKPVFGQETVELAYIPGARRELDRFRTNLRIPGLNMIGDLKSGEIALEWGVNWDFLIDVGFPWQKAAGYDWFRAFSLPMGAYEAKFGFYLEKRTQLAPRGSQQLVLSAGVGFYIGYYFGFSSSIVWLRAGIGVFAILQGTVVLEGGGQGLAALRGTIVELRVRGVVGIFAYGEGGIDVWILSARFRVSVQAAIGMEIVLMKNLPCFATYAATLSAGYEASVRVGSGWFSWTFSVSGSVQIGVSGRLLLN